MLMGSNTEVQRPESNVSLKLQTVWCSETLQLEASGNKDLPVKTARSGFCDMVQYNSHRHTISFETAEVSVVLSQRCPIQVSLELESLLGTTLLSSGVPCIGLISPTHYFFFLGLLFHPCMMCH